MKALIIDTVHNLLINKLNTCDIETNYLPNITRQEILSTISNYEILVIRSKIPIDKEILDKAEKLKIIGRYGAGTEGIDKQLCEQKGIKIINSPEGNRNAVGEHTLGLLLAVINKICKSFLEIKNGIWDRNSNWGLELENKTIGIIGYGNAGSAFARKLAGFDVEVLAYDKYKSGFGKGYIREASLEDIMSYADVISFHVPLNEETRQMANSSFFTKLKKTPLILNTSRGEVVNTQDLVTSLKNGIISGAGLDVLEYEKSTFENIYKTCNKTLEELLKLDNVVVTPHIAGWTNESYRKLALYLAKKICSSIKI